MNIRISRRSLWLAALISSLSALGQTANATIVEFDTNLGVFQVNLYDTSTPATVANFLDYVNSLAYSSSVFHRLAPGFVLQGGGFRYNNLTSEITAIPDNGTIINEPVFSNVMGTIAMAKTNAGPNTATNQWFFNLVDSSANLDVQNGGFTVFGEVVGAGMDVVNAMAATTIFDANAAYPLLNGNFGSVPLQGNVANVPLDATNFIIINAITITDLTVDSAAGLNPPLNTLINAPPPVTPPPSLGGGGGGGSVGFFALFGLLLGYRFRRV